MKVLFIGIILSAFMSCEPMKDPKPVSTSTHGDYYLELLFEKDGCKVYKFRDAGRNIYWSTCEGKLQYSYSQQAGKTTTTHHVEASTSVQVSDTTKTSKEPNAGDQP